MLRKLILFCATNNKHLKLSNKTITVSLDCECKRICHIDIEYSRY